MSGLSVTIVGALAVAAVSTLGDFVWAMWIPEHRAVYGLTHGALLFLAIGLFLGVVAHRAVAGAVAGALIGLLAAGMFYLIAPLLGFSAMFVAWIAVWLALAALYGHLNTPRASAAGGAPVARSGASVTAARGAIAAAASGLAFYSISGIWRPFDPEGWDYAVHFGAWVVAYFPGFAALLIGRRPPAAPSRL